MPRGRRKVKLRYGKASVSYEWLGFRDAGSESNLDTSTSFELVGPAGASGILHPEYTVMRIIGTIGFRYQATVTTSTRAGAIVQLANVGGDQAIDNGINPLSTDLDDFDHKGIMWWRTWTNPVAEVVVAEGDEIQRVIPVDIKTKRIITKRDTLIVRIDASTTARLRTSVNLRVLVKLRGV